MTSLLIIDVHYFKIYNDQYSHLAGDECLHHVAQVIAGVIRRPGDFAARYGGEEFAVILLGTDAEGGNHIAQRILGAIRSLAIRHAEDAEISIVTVSIGAAHRAVGD